MKTSHLKKILPKTQDVKDRTLRLTRVSKWISLYILIGLIAGLGAILFHYLCHIGSHVFLDYMAGYHPPHPAGEYSMSCCVVSSDILATEKN